MQDQTGLLSVVLLGRHEHGLVATQLTALAHVLRAGGDEEADSSAANRLVLLGRHRDPVGARLVGAFAHPLPDREDEAETLVQILDALVDLAEQALVLRGPNFAVKRLLGDSHLEPPASRFRFGRGSTLEALRRSAAQT